MIDLSGKRVLVTQARDFMGPALCETFASLGATVIPDDLPLVDPQRPAEVVRAAGRVDVLLAHLSLPAPRSTAVEATDEEWREVFGHLVDPLPRLVRAVLPQMIERRAGKILLVGSAAAMRGQKRASTYSAARGAQLAYIQTVGIEAAPHDVQVNAIAQNFVDNPTYFPAEVQARAEALVASGRVDRRDGRRQDLTHFNIFTIDGQSTLDFDDALSLETTPEGIRLGIHIVDVAHFVQKDGPVDREAQGRGSSIYMADQKIPMLPSSLAEGLCSLKAGEVRPAISTLIDLTPELDIRGYRLFPSIVQVKDQRTYFDVNLAADQDPALRQLRSIARKFRESRLAAGAVHISVPEINLWIGEAGEVNLNRVNRESPGRMLVAEIMIMANWLMARFLAEHRMPAVFRSQPEPRERLYRGGEGTLFQHWMQRRLLNRFVLGHAPEKHSGLGLNAYVTATSPIRKYFDLVTQRQVRAVLGLEEPYSTEDIDAIIQALESPMSQVARLQTVRQRYWLLKHLEQRVGQKAEAIVLVRRRNGYQVLLTDYMLECDLAINGFSDLKPEDLVQVTLQKVDARKDLITLTLG